MLGKSPIKWRQRPVMTLAVDWNVKHQFKQTKTLKLNVCPYAKKRKEKEMKKKSEMVFYTL